MVAKPKASKYLQSQIKEVLNATWFLVTGSEEITEARRGSRPGDSMADLLFTIAFRHLLSKFQDTLRQEGVFTELWWSGRREPIATDDCLQRQEVLGPIWADDLAIMLAASNSSILMQRVGKVAGVLIDTLLVHGMQPNLKPSKSEVFVDLRGEGSVDCRRKIHEDDYKLHTTSEYLPEPLRIVGSYKHLGTWIQTNGKVVKELRCRFGAAHQTITKYKGAIFGNRAMAMHKKVQLFNTLVLSAVLYNSPTWMITRKHDVQRLHSGIMKLYRRVTMGHLGPITQKWSDEKVQASLELPDPLDLLHVYRLRYVQHLYRAGDAIVWATLQQHPYWWQMLDKSLETTYTSDFTRGILPRTLGLVGTVATGQWQGVAIHCTASYGALGLTDPISLLVFVGHHWWIQLITSDAEVQRYAEPVLLVCALNVAFECVCTVSSGSLKGCGRQVILAPVVILSYFCIGIPSAWLSPLPGHRTAATLALGTSLGTATHTLAVCVILWTTNWVVMSARARERVESHRSKEPLL
eukprot:symbB.v1.2.007292.t1/scaffold443.1/size206750/5